MSNYMCVYTTTRFSHFPHFSQILRGFNLSWRRRVSFGILGTHHTITGNCKQSCHQLAVAAASKSRTFPRHFADWERVRVTGGSGCQFWPSYWPSEVIFKNPFAWLRSWLRDFPPFHLFSYIRTPFSLSNWPEDNFLWYNFHVLVFQFSPF